MGDAPRGRRTVLFLTISIAVVALVAGGAWYASSRSGPERSAAALCDRLAETAALDDALVTLDPTMLGPQVSALQRSVEVAPDDIRPQLAELSQFVTEIGDEVRAAPTDKKQVLVEALAARQDRVDTITADGRAVEVWAETNCDTRLRGSTSTTRSTTTTVPRSTSTTVASTSTTSTVRSTTTTRPTTTTR